MLRIAQVTLAVALLVTPGCLRADTNDGASLAPWRENLRFALDVSARASYDTREEELARIEFLGFDLHKVFSSNTGDWGTLLLQGYMTRIDGVERHPPFFDDSHDWEFVYRIFNLNVTRFGGRAFNVRIGHFEVPFGLEQVINTNGTLRDYTHGRNLGLKADWGVTINGDLPAFEYELAVSRGSGNTWETRGRPHVLSGRVGTSRDRSIILGLGAFKADVVDEAEPDGTRSRWRVGADAQWYVGRFGVLGELAIGADEGREVVNGLLELDLASRDDSWLLFAQARRFAEEFRGHGWDAATRVSLGITYSLPRELDLSAQWERDLSAFRGQREANAVTVQIRQRF